jgi:hypothetical protein
MNDERIKKNALLQHGGIVKGDSELVSTVCPSKLSLPSDSQWVQIKILEENKLLLKKKKNAQQTEEKAQEK